MRLWLSENIGTIVISLGLLLIVFLIIRGMIRDRREGRSSCGSACSHCPMSGACHKKALVQRRKVSHAENHT